MTDSNDPCPMPSRVMVTPAGCWLWTGRTTRKGYGVLWIDGKDRRAHRWMYEQAVRTLDPSEPLDHLCHDSSTCRPPMQCQHRLCVNPQHLEPVTVAENNQRAKRDSCRRGHPWTEQSTIVRTAAGGRECRTCRLERRRKK